MATINHLLQRAIHAHTSGDLAGALNGYRQLLEKAPGHPDGLHLHGITLLQMGKPGQAAEFLQAAIDANPKVPSFHMNLGSTLSALGQIEDAKACYAKATELDPNFVDGWRNRGNFASRTDDHELAARCFSEVMRISQGKDGPALGYLCLALAVLCDWDNLDLARAALVRNRPGLSSAVPPFTTLIHDFTPMDQRQLADQAASEFHNDAMKALGGRGFSHDDHGRQRPARLKVGFLGDDFQDHAVGYLFVGLAEALDRDRFDVTIYSYAAASDSATRRRIVAASDSFVDISRQSWAQAANQIHRDGIDILIDLKGHTGIPRAQILAARPAPIQAAWLGYPGTFGGPDLDYILADSIVIPPGLDECYSEKVVRLPRCYQSNDPKRPRAAKPPARATLGLPDKAFVWGALGNPFKITRTMFASWMDILKETGNSVLWLLEHHPQANEHLMTAAEAADVDPSRLIFAPRVSQADHLARLAAVDVALDTYPYGGHTTTSDYFWAGVPVVALMGQTFASRVAGSLCAAAGVPELATNDLTAYRQLAVDLYGSKKRHTALKVKLDKARTSAPLFDAPTFARGFERALDTMFERWAKGEPPSAITLAE